MVRGTLRSQIERFIKIESEKALSVSIQNNQTSCFVSTLGNNTMSCCIFLSLPGLPTATKFVLQSCHFLTCATNLYSGPIFDNLKFLNQKHQGNKEYLGTGYPLNFTTYNTILLSPYLHLTIFPQPFKY